MELGINAQYKTTSPVYDRLLLLPPRCSCGGICSDARIGPTSRVAFGLDAHRWERGKRTSRGAASCCWTGPRTTTTPPRRLAASATVQLLRLGRTTRTVTVRPAVPDMARRPPVSLGPVSLTRALRTRPASRRDALGRAAHASADPGHGPPAAGPRLCPSLPARMLFLLTLLGSDGDALALVTPATGYSAISRFARWSAGRGIGWQRTRVCRLGGVNCPLG